MTANESFVPQFKCEEDWMKAFTSHGGIFFGENPLASVFSFTMIRFSMFFIISNILHRLLKPLKQPTYFCNLMAGIILGPTVLGRYKEYEKIKDIPSHAQFLNFGAYLGVLYYIFIIGVKIDVEMVLRLRRRIWVIVLSSMFAPLLVMAILLTVLHPLPLNIPKRIPYVFSIQLSSTWFTNLAPMLEELNLLATELGQFSLSLALANEFIMWSIGILLFILKTMHHGILKSFLSLSIVITLIIFVKPAILRMVRRFPPGEPVKEIYVIGTLLCAVVMACISDMLIGSAVTGIAFFGLIVPNGPPLGLAITERGETFIKSCLIPFFYLAIGDMTSMSEVSDFKGHIVYQLIIIVGYLTKTITTMCFATWYDMSIRQGFSLGLIMNTSGVLHVISFWTNWLRQLSTREISSQLVVSSMIVTSLVTPLILHFQTRTKRLNSIRGFQLSLQSTITSPRMHILACIDNEDEIIGLISLLKASNPTPLNPICFYLVHLVELVGQAAPMVIPHKKHKRVCKYNGCVSIMSALKSYFKMSQGGITMQLLTMITPFTSMHEDICKLAEEKVIPLIIIPYIYKSLCSYGKRNISSQINRQLQEQSPCTIGIFLNNDKNSKHINQSYFSYHIAVIFCGGEDDREALVYATRMSSHPGVSIIMLRIIIQDYQYISEHEKMLDESLVDSFKANITCNACAAYQEVHVDDLVQALDVVRSLDKTYNLIMVGRRHGVLASGVEEQMYFQTDNPELGYIGELLMSAELHLDTTSILVMQHYVDVVTDNIGNLVLLEDDDF